MTDLNRLPVKADDPLLSRAITDWQAIAHGGGIEAFLADLKELWKRDSAPNQPFSKNAQDMEAMNNELYKQGWLPNMEIFGVRDNHIIIKDRTRIGVYGVLEQHNGLTQIEDAQLNLPAGPLQVQPDARLPLKDAANEVSPEGVRQGDIGDCRFEAQLASLAAGAMTECSTAMISLDWLATKLGASPLCREHITGSVGQWSDANNRGIVAADKRDLEKILKEALGNSMITTIFFSLEGLSMPKNDQAFDTAGNAIKLENNHCYSVLAYDSDKHTVTLRNPWGQNFNASGLSLIGDGTVVLSFEQFRSLAEGITVEKTSRSH